MDQLLVEDKRFPWSADMRLRCAKYDGAEKLKEMLRYDFKDVVAKICDGRREA